MYKYLACIISVIATLTLSASTCRAKEYATSASFKQDSEVSGFDYRVENLENFFKKYGSLLSNYSEDFVRYADIYGLDYRLVPAISGVESTFGKRIPYNSYNAYGWANGAYAFESWEDSIETVTGTLRTKYVNKGALSIDKIGRIYAPPSKTWAGTVKFFVAKIDVMPVSFDI